VSESSALRERYWPALPVEAWLDTINTLHMWTQIVGKIRLAQSPWVNHSWDVTLYVTPRGLTTSPIYETLKDLWRPNPRQRGEVHASPMAESESLGCDFAARPRPHAAIRSGEARR